MKRYICRACGKFANPPKGSSDVECPHCGAITGNPEIRTESVMPAANVERIGKDEVAKMKYPNGRRYPKNDGSKSYLTVLWNKPAHEEVDLQYYWRMSNDHFNSPNRPVMKPDINLLMHHFQSLKGYSGRTLVEELVHRGYDISTLKFTIEKLKP